MVLFTKQAGGALATARKTGVLSQPSVPFLRVPVIISPAPALVKREFQQARPEARARSPVSFEFEPFIGWPREPRGRVPSAGKNPRSP